jgi:hypothetical protein
MPLVGIINNPLGAVVLAALHTADDPMALFVNRTVEEVIFGWEDPLLEIIHALLLPDLPTRYPGLQGNDSSPAEAAAKHGRDRMYTGLLTQNLARELVEWDGSPEMLCCAYGPCGDAGSGNSSSGVLPWHTDSAEQIQGSWGDQFHFGVGDDDVLRVSTHGFGIYRWWPLRRTSSYDVQGVTVSRFAMPTGTLGNDSVDPDEARAYDIHGPSGLLNLSRCEWGAPVYVSKPRFLDGSDSLRDGVTGMGAPDRDAHDTYLGVEPISGQTLDFHFRVGEWR